MRRELADELEAKRQQALLDLQARPLENERHQQQLFEQEKRRLVAAHQEIHEQRQQALAERAQQASALEAAKAQQALALEAERARVARASCALALTAPAHDTCVLLRLPRQWLLQALCYAFQLSSPFFCAVLCWLALDGFPLACRQASGMFFVGTQGLAPSLLCVAGCWAVGCAAVARGLSVLGSTASAAASLQIQVLED